LPLSLAPREPARLLALLALVTGCAQAVPRPPAPACAAPCALIREVAFPDRIAVDVHVATGTRLENAAVTSSAGAACKSGVPVAAVSVDDQAYPEGPASLEVHGHLGLRFPFVADGDAPDARISGPPVLDLDLGLAGGRRCLRVPLPDPGTGLMSLTRRLSFRLEERP
jgi:hypothetical protein